MGSMDSSSGIQRRQSGRGQIDALAGSTAAREPKSFNLVVCGETDKTSGWIFSDFMGFCSTFKECGVGGDFYSCFPLEDHFIWLRNENSPAIDTIKFGKFGPDGSKALYTYSRHQFLNREYFWTQVGKHDLLLRVETWIAEKKSQAEQGDVVNIVLEGHGNRKGEFLIGDRKLHKDVFRDLLAGFKTGVQVNAISGACYSGQFLDTMKSSSQMSRYITVAAPRNESAWSATRSVSNRLRNSRFSAAFVQSLAKFKLPGIPRRRVTWRIRDHEAFMKDQLTRNLTPGVTITEPQFYATADVDPVSFLETLIFRDKVDVVYDPRQASRRRRIEWPTVDPDVRRNLSRENRPPNSAIPSSAKAVLDNEVSKCDIRRGYPPDIRVYDELFVKSPNWRQLMRNLYWRARRQSAVWDVFELLVARGFLHPRCLTVPIDLVGMSHDTGLVVGLLYCFSFISEDCDRAFNGEIPLQAEDWDSDIEWLATMILRSGASLDRLFDTIHACGFLGNIIPEKLQLFLEANPAACLKQCPCDRQGVLDANGEVHPSKNVFGFWLPHGLSVDDEVFATQLRGCFARFNAIERAFRETEQIPADKLLLEEEQMNFFAAHEDRLPGASNDFPEATVTYSDTEGV